MIGKLKGILDSVDEEGLIIDVNGVGALMRQAHVVVLAADRVGPADDRRDRGGVLLQVGGQIGDDLLTARILPGVKPPTGILIRIGFN